MELKYAWSGLHQSNIIHGNWPGEIPTVYRWPYDYSKPGHDTDFIPQTVPFSETMSSNLPHDFEDNPAGLGAIQ